MSMSKQEKQWQAESDARTLTEAQEIRSDADRYKAAKRELKKQVEATTKAALEEKVRVKLDKLKE